MHCSYAVFQSKFCLYTKGRYPWNEVDEQKKLLSEPANFSASDRLGRSFRTVQNGVEKRKNLYLINWSQNEK